MRRNVGIRLRRFWHAHRRRLAVAIVVLPVLATMVFSAIGGGEPRLRPPTRAQVCDATRETVDEIAMSHPDAPRQSLDDLEEQACTRDPRPAPSVAASAVPPTPGCRLLEGAKRRSPAPVRAAPPRRPVPFFAARSGRVPPTGTPRVGGVQLPAGSRCGPFWATDAGVPDSIALAGKLAAVFPSTGLWPVLWEQDEPDHYVHGGRAVERVGSLDAGALLRRVWRRSDAGERPFPGLAAAGPVPKRLAVKPFGDTLEAAAELPPGGPILVLVPVNRPADVTAVLGMRHTIYFSDSELSAVLRSFEDRFGAVVTTMGPGEVGLVVGAPPSDDEQIDRLAAEHATFAPDLWSAADLHHLLRSDRTVPGTTSKRYWAFGWPD